MKKSLLLIGGLMTSAVMMADINLYMGSQELTPGQKYWYNEMNVSDEGNYVDVKIDPSMSIKADKLTFDVQVTAECTSGQQIQMCCGSECVMGEKVVKSGIKLSADNAMPLDFEFAGEFDSANDIPKGITTDFTVEELGVESSKKTYTLILNDADGSVEVIERDSDVMVIGDALSYNLSEPTRIAIYSLDGSRIIDRTVNGAGSIDLSSLGKGIYVYRLSGASNISGKIFK